MICQQCQKKIATVHIVHNNNGKHMELFLCGNCAANSEKITFKFPFDFDSEFHINLNDLLPKPASSGERLYTAQQEKRCNTCQMSFSEFQKSGKMGCETCYETFGNEMMPIISRIHGNTEYKGKMPGERPGDKTNLTPIAVLRKELKEAIAKEEYERAAQIRDEIKTLEKEQNV